VQTVSLAVVGATHPNKRGPTRVFGISLCRPGDPIELRREPKNPKDEYAVAVYASDIQIGYLTAERAPWIGAMILNGREIEAVFQMATQHGCVIRVAFDGTTMELPAADVLISVEHPDFYPDDEYPEE
jgi:hypothetical protein